MYFLQRRHSPYHHPAQLFHPSFAYMLANPDERMKHCGRSKFAGHAKRTCQSNNNNNNNTYLHVVEETERFLMFTDLPGVKVDDLKVELTSEGVLRIHGERKNNKKDEESTTAKKFDRQFMVDDQLIDTTQITASLEDGTLQIVAPKKEALKPCRVAVVAGTPNTTIVEEQEDGSLSFNLDVPGVKVDALQVEVHTNGKLVIEGERKNRGVGQSTTKIYRSFSLNRRVVDTEKVQAFLEDGVLTIRAPKKETPVSRSIPVSGSHPVVVEEKHGSEEKTEVATDITKEDNVETKEDEEEEDKVEETEKKAEEDSTTDASSTVEAEEEEEQKSTDKSTDSLEAEFEVVPETVKEDDE